tara:strand:+ start:29873 stop:30847 length:975 start_codon:yes stop_codon:yes gene_type:complete
LKDLALTTVLLTGATGFLGGALVGQLLQIGQYRTRLAVRAPDKSTIGQAQRIAVGSIGSQTDWTAAVENVDCVIHCAARAHIMSDKDTDPLEAYREVNTRGTLRLARQSADAGCKRFIYISSAKVHGEQTLAGTPFSEAMPLAPLGSYALSKAEAEAGLADISKESGMDIVIIRPPLIYGPGVKANFASLTKSVRLGIPLPLGAITSNRRSFVGIRNLCDFILVCLRYPNALNDTFLVSDGCYVSTVHLLKQLATAANKRMWLIPVPLALLEAGARVMGKQSVLDRLTESFELNVSKATEILGWHPPYSMREELEFALDAKHSA